MNSCSACAGRLEFVELEPGLVCAVCTGCKGSGIPMMNYRFWVQQQNAAENEVGKVSSDTVAEDYPSIRTCYKCQHLMNKYRIDMATPNKVDYCGHCDEIWLDENEWELLKAKGIHRQLHKVVTEGWQKQQKKNYFEEREKERLTSILGERDTNYLLEVKAWASTHPEKTVIYQHLNRMDKN